MVSSLIEVMHQRRASPRQPVSRCRCIWLLSSAASRLNSSRTTSSPACSSLSCATSESSCAIRSNFRCLEYKLRLILAINTC